MRRALATTAAVVMMAGPAWAGTYPGMCKILNEEIEGSQQIIANYQRQRAEGAAGLQNPESSASEYDTALKTFDSASEKFWQAIAHLADLVVVRRELECPR